MKKVVLITGASAGMGKEIAKYLAGKGYIVYSAARRLDKMADLESLGIHILKMDVTDNDSMVDGVRRIMDAEKRIDILINNAGFGSYGAIEDVPIADAKYQLDVNVFGAAALIQLALPHMRKNNSGKIINISSIGGKIAMPLGGWYHASKFALEGLSDSLRNEVKPFGIDVIVIEPGGIKSEWAQIAHDNLIKISGHTAYENLATGFLSGFKMADEKSPEPAIIAELIYKAVTAKKPKTRYSAGYMAKPILLLRKLLSDKMMDNLFMSQIKSVAKN